MQSEKNLLSPLPRPVIVLSCVVLLVFVILFYMYNRIVSIGKTAGQGMGTVAGKAVGSLEGMTRGRDEGSAAGKEAGLSAEDTEAEIANEIQKLENLEVLVASVKLRNVHTIGEDVEYAAVYLMKGDAVFSVDLSRADIQLRDNDLQVTLPLPHGELYIDDGQIEKAAEYQKYFFSGSVEAGFDAYLNSMKKIHQASVDTLDNYDALIAAARETAEKQVKLLVSSVSANAHQVNVDFKEG